MNTGMCPVCGHSLLSGVWVDSAFVHTCIFHAPTYTPNWHPVDGGCRPFLPLTEKDVRRICQEEMRSIAKRCIELAESVGGLTSWGREVIEKELLR